MNKIFTVHHVKTAAFSILQKYINPEDDINTIIMITISSIIFSVYLKHIFQHFDHHWKTLHSYALWDMKYSFSAIVVTSCWSQNCFVPNKNSSIKIFNTTHHVQYHTIFFLFTVLPFETQIINFTNYRIPAVCVQFKASSDVHVQYFTVAR